MQKSWSNIPIEVLQMIFEIIHNDDYGVKPDLVQCELVCRNWTVPAQTIAFNAIDLNCTGNLELDDMEEEEESLPYWMPDEKVEGEEEEFRVRRWIRSFRPSDTSPWSHVKHLRRGFSLNHALLPNRKSTQDKLARNFPNVEHIQAWNADSSFYSKMMHTVLADSNAISLKQFQCLKLTMPSLCTCTAF
jgi:hypothetical protein